MTPNSGRAIEIFTEATQLPVEQRAAFLDRACAGDEELRQKIEALLKSNDRAGGFLEEPISSTLKGGDRTVGEQPGDSVGRYKLVQQIGEGGCGIVFLAEQEEPVRRQVALKVIKPGMDTRSVIARFEVERQALAMMEHPNIAQVFDAGATGNGRPFFVMELVRGAKITEYCDQHSLTTAARLDLFTQVCDAVQHAHLKGVIHRDLKPSNILVAALPGGKPLPKVIDFGIAKATAGELLPLKTASTSSEMLVGTPAYMSPEQAALTSADVDTRTDVYGLGVLLYELLTGTTPFDTRELLKGGFDEARRVIRDETPVRPSARLSTMAGADLASVSRQHGAGAPRLIRETRGDLDWIVMKALEKDRARRYQTANGLAEDIQRYLKNEPISARPPSRVYQFKKLVLRHKLGFAAFGVVLATLVAALASTAWAFGKEKRAHHEASAEADRSRQVTEFFKRMVFGVHPVVALGRDTSIPQEILDWSVTNLDLELTNQPAVQADLKMAFGGLYVAVGRGDKAEPLLRDALAFYRKSPKGNERQISDTLSRLCLLHLTSRPPKMDEAEQEIQEAIALETKFAAMPNLQIMVLKTRLGWIRLRRGQAAEAESIFREALDQGRPLAEQMPETLLDTRGALATALGAQNKLNAAEALLRESITLERERLDPKYPFVSNDLFRLADVLDREGKPGDAESALHECLELRRKLVAPDHPAIDETLTALGSVLREQSKYTEAEGVYWELLEFRRKRPGDNHTRIAQAVTDLAEVLTATHNESEFARLAGEFPRAWVARSEYSAGQGHWSDALASASIDFRII
jgi:serine/threonine protein kinase